jgi:iron(III) transport system ATP-binding protein
MLFVRNIRFGFDEEILSNISFKLKKGETLGIVGKSGIGKSTLLKIISGHLQTHSGSVVLDGERILGPNEKLIPGNQDIQLVNQDFALDLYHTTKENLILKANHLPTEICENFCLELLDLLELRHIENQKAINLSGGEQQRLALGRALASEPKIILLDEPFVHLDIYLKRKIIRYISELKKIQKTSLIMVTHDGQEALNLCDKIAFLNESKIQRIDKPRAYYYEPRSKFEASFFGEINEVRIHSLKVLFRPNEFSLDINGENDGVLNVKFKSSLFSGFYYENLFVTSRKEYIVLYYEKILNNITQIAIHKKNKNFTLERSF